MATPYLIADSAQVTVLRSLASTAFGKYSLALPEGVDLEDVYEVSAAGNELAYVSSLGSKRRVGGMFRRFVRADVSVTAEGEDVVPASDVERVLDEAAKRVSGDFFLESDISKAGLGPWVPMVDFQVGDIANVEIWGRVVPLAVTRIEPKRTDHSDNDWSIHVGGQLLSDSEARLAENTDIYNAVVSDRRELAGLDGKIRAETKNRKSAIASESARSDAYADAVGERVSDSLTAELQAYGEKVKEAKNYVDPATQQVVDFWSEENQNNFNKAVQLTLSAQDAYNDINNIKWLSQDAWNEQQEKINAQNEEFQRLTKQLDAQQSEQIKQLSAVQQQMAEESQGQIRELMATRADSSDPQIRPTPRADGKPGWQVTLTDMVRGALFHIQWYDVKGTTNTGGSIVEPTAQVVNTLSTNAESYTLQCDSNEYIYVRWVRQAKKQVSVDKSDGGWDVPRSSWEYIMSYPAPSTTARQVTLRLKVTWAAATYDDSYSIRIRAGNRTLKTFTESRLGPINPFGDGERWMSMTVHDETVQAGETIKVDVYSTALLPGGRRVKEAELTGTWIEEV